MLHNCKVTRVVDADTFKGIVELDFGITLAITVRLSDCDAYEIHGPEKKEGLEAKEYVESVIGGSIVVLEPYKTDSFGRWLCRVLVKNKTLTALLKEHGYLKEKASST